VTELFALRLRTMLWVEQTLADDVLPRLAEQAPTELRAAIERHLVETRGQARTLERLADGPPVESPALLGVLAECEPLGDVALAATMVDQLEIAAYEWLVATANALGREDVALQLEELLEQERFALELAEQAHARLL